MNKFGIQGMRMKTANGIFGWLTLCFILLISGCGGGNAGTDDGLTVAVIPKGTTHEFWKAIHAGAVKAQQELQGKGTKIEVIWKGPLKEDDREQQIQVVENFIGRRVDGIVLAPLDAEALVAPVEAAGQAGIPVVIVDSDLNTKQRVSYIATDNYKGGSLAADQLGELLGGKGEVLMLRYQTGSASTEAREAGFFDTIKKKYPNIQLISSDQHAGPTRETAYQASQNLLNRYGRTVTGVFAPNESSSVGMLLALRDIRRAGGDVKFVGFDASTTLVEALKAGDVQGIVVQNPFAMGYNSVITLADHLNKKQVPSQIDSGVMMVTPDNIDAPEVDEFIHPPVAQYVKE